VAKVLRIQVQKLVWRGMTSQGESEQTRVGSRNYRREKVQKLQCIRGISGAAEGAKEENYLGQSGDVVGGVQGVRADRPGGARDEAYRGSRAKHKTREGKYKGDGGAAECSAEKPGPRGVVVERWVVVGGCDGDVASEGSGGQELGESRLPEKL
jgi:hypothetical protein